MRNVDNIDTGTILSGQPVSMPLALAPIGLAGRLAEAGKLLVQTNRMVFFRLTAPFPEHRQERSVLRR